MDFSIIIPRMREAIEDYIARKRDQGKDISDRDAIVKWLELYYDSWMEAQTGTLPVTADGPERRRGRRVPIEISTYYRVLWSPTSDLRSETPISATAEVKNISSGGLYIVTGRSYPLATLMELEFELPGIPESVAAFAMVVWREERAGDRFGHGLHFSHIEADYVDVINELIMEKILDAPVVVVSDETKKEE